MPPSWDSVSSKLWLEALLLLFLFNLSIKGTHIGGNAGCGVLELSPSVAYGPLDAALGVAMAMPSQSPPQSTDRQEHRHEAPEIALPLDPQANMSWDLTKAPGMELGF